MEFTEQEIAQMLAALRFSQLPHNDITEMPHFEDTEPLSDEAIDSLCENLNCGRLPTRYTVVGLYPRWAWDNDLHDSSFATLVEGTTPTEAIEAARKQVARCYYRLEDGEEDDELDESIEEFRRGVIILAAFPGLVKDEYDPDAEEDQGHATDSE